MKKKSTLLLWLLAVTAVLVAAVGGYLKYAVMRPLGLYEEERMIAVPFLLLADEEAQDTLRQAHSPTLAPTQPPVTETEPSAKPATEPETEPATDPATEPPTEPAGPVDESWFDDVLFIGDSRIEGLSMYSPLGNAHYFCKTGMSIMNARLVKCYSKDFPSILLEKLLDKYQYGKIYICLGINGIQHNVDDMLEKYADLIAMIREKQPEAHIVLQSIMTVGRYKAASKDYFSLERIQMINEGIAGLVTDDHIHFLDVNEWVADEEGYLPDEMSKDGCHLHGAAYQDYNNWFLESAATLGID